MTIFKIQKPLFSNAPNAPFMCYPRKGKPTVFLHADDIAPDLLKRLLDDCASTGKAYYECELMPDGGLAVGVRVKDERW